MQLQAPDYANRTPEQIISEVVHFDSVGYVYRSLSWLDVYKRMRTVCALNYAAGDLRQGIEQLLFEELVLSAYDRIDSVEYEKCKGNATKFKKLISSLSPEYERLSIFTRIVTSSDPACPILVRWDHRRLMRYWAEISQYLHWAGQPRETYESQEWLDNAYRSIIAAATFIWDKKLEGYTGVMQPAEMSTNVRALWTQFRTSELSEVELHQFFKR